jgi:hypothetical protein
VPRADGLSLLLLQGLLQHSYVRPSDYLDPFDSPPLDGGCGVSQRSVLSHAGPISIGCCVFGLSWSGEFWSRAIRVCKADCWTFWVGCQVSLTQSLGLAPILSQGGRNRGFYRYSSGRRGIVTKVTSS